MIWKMKTTSHKYTVLPKIAWLMMMNFHIYTVPLEKDCILNKDRFHIILLHEMVYFHIPFPRTAPNNKISVVD